MRRRWYMFQAMTKKTRKPTSDDPKPGTKPVILKPLTVEEAKEVLKRYSPDRGEKQKSA